MNLLRNLASFASMLADEFTLWLQSTAAEEIATVVPLRPPCICACCAERAELRAAGRPDDPLRYCWCDQYPEEERCDCGPCLAAAELRRTTRSPDMEELEHG